MKRAGNLIEKIADTDNLYYAFWKARKGKDGAFEVEKFRNNLEKNISHLQQQIQSGSVSAGGYHYFTISTPKNAKYVQHHLLKEFCIMHS